jgi:hypothetical protein
MIQTISINTVEFYAYALLFISMISSLHTTHSLINIGKYSSIYYVQALFYFVVSVGLYLFSILYIGFNDRGYIQIGLQSTFIIGSLFGYFASTYKAHNIKKNIKCYTPYNKINNKQEMLEYSIVSEV